MNQRPPEPSDIQATFAATLVDEWHERGVRHAVVCPGSRSTPLAVALARSPIAVHVHQDERAGAFVAVGLGRATGQPAVVVTTSGTAAVEVHPAVVEAHHDAVPMIVATADRPPRLRGRGAPQTIDQVRLYGSSVRWFSDPGVPRWDARSVWRAVARTAWRRSLGPVPGPTHLNLAFDEPLLGDVVGLPEADTGTSAPAGVAQDPWPGEVDLGPRGLIVAGGARTGPGAVARLSDATGWPVLADPRSGARLPHPATVAHFDALLRHGPFAGAHRPEVVLQLGGLPASRVLSEWLSACEEAGTRRVVVDPYGRALDPLRSATAVIAHDPNGLAGELAERAARPDAGWLESWRAADDAAAAAIADAVEGGPVTSEVATARAVLDTAPEGSAVVVASSMPVRDVEWYTAPRAGVDVHSNRGANGIDGVISTAVGVAIGSGAPAVALVGDLAFLHDSNALLGLSGRLADVRVVVVDNRGGGIFSFLPQADTLADREFEQLFGTPHQADLVALAEAHGLPARRAASIDDVRAAVTEPGPSVMVVPSSRSANVAHHREIHAAVAGALEA